MAYIASVADVLRVTPFKRLSLSNGEPYKTAATEAMAYICKLLLKLVLIQHRCILGINI